MSEDLQVQKKGNGAYVAIIIILLLLLALMAYLWSSKNTLLSDCETKNEQLLSDMEGMNEMMSGYLGNMSNDIKTDFKNMLATYDALLEKDKTQADSINKQKDRIQQLLAQVESGKMTAHQLYLARKEIETMKRIMRGYIQQIDSLNTLNLQLSTDLAQTTDNLNRTTEERDVARQDAEEKGEQVKIGQRLKAYSFTSGGLKMKINNTTTETTRANNCVEMYSRFTIGENQLTEAGNKTVYMQIIAPDGKTLQNSASAVVNTNSGAVPYSDKKDINYTQQSVDVAIYFKLKGEEVAKGNYKVKIYCQGDLIGSDSFTLK